MARPERPGRDPAGRRIGKALSDKPSELVDVHDLSLRDLRRLPDAPVADALARVLQQLDDRGEPVAGFQSAV